MESNNSLVITKPDGERIEIEVPSDAYGFEYYFVNKDGCKIHLQKNCSACTGRIELSRPKIKVKKTVSVSLFNDATAKWDTKDIDMRGRPTFVGTFPMEIEVEDDL